MPYPKDRKAFHVLITELTNGRVHTSFWYYTDCRYEKETDDVPVKEIIKWIGTP